MTVTCKIFAYFEQAESMAFNNIFVTTVSLESKILFFFLSHGIFLFLQAATSVAIF